MKIRKELILSMFLAIALVISAGCRGDDDDKDGGVTGDQKVVTGDGAPDSGPASEATIAKIMGGTVAKGSKVLLKSVIVTAVDGSGTYKGDVYVQDSKGGKHSAIKLYRPQRADGKKISELKVGDVVNVEGLVKYWHPKAGEFDDKKCTKKKHIKELDKATITYIKAGTAPDPAVVTAKDLLDCTVADSYEHVLVTLKKVTVLKAEKPAGKTYFEVVVSGGAEIGDDLFPTSTLKKDGCYSFTGVIAYFYGYRLHVRSAADMKTDTGCPKTKTLTIKDIQDTKSANHPAKDSLVKVVGVVTAVDAKKSTSGYLKGFWIQDETATGPYNGLYVYGYSWKDTDVAAKKPVVGDKVEVSGTYKEYYDLTELDKASFVKKGTATVPAALKVKAADIKTGATTAEGYEGMLVQVDNITVGDTVKTTGTTPVAVGFKDKTSSLIVENMIFDFMKPTAPAKDTVYKSVVGVMGYSYKERRLYPRTAADMTK